MSVVDEFAVVRRAASERERNSSGCFGAGGGLDASRDIFSLTVEFAPELRNQGSSLIVVDLFE